jgi:hypothetical protein
LVKAKAFDWRNPDPVESDILPDNFDQTSFDQFEHNLPLIIPGSNTRMFVKPCITAEISSWLKKI